MRVDQCRRSFEATLSERKSNFEKLRCGPLYGQGFSDLFFLSHDWLFDKNCDPVWAFAGSWCGWRTRSSAGKSNIDQNGCFLHIVEDPKFPKKMQLVAQNRLHVCAKSRGGGGERPKKTSLCMKQNLAVCKLSSVGSSSLQHSFTSHTFLQANMRFDIE